MKQEWKLKIFEWGRFALDGGAMFGVIPKPLWSKLIAPDDLNRVPLSLRSLYLERGSHKVLVDLGMGYDWDDKSRKIYDLHSAPAQELMSEQLGVHPDEITHVVLTHLHFDHCGFLVSKSGDQMQSTFKNAEIFVCEQNFRNALQPNPRESASYLSKLWAEPLRLGQFTLVKAQWLEHVEVLSGIHMRRVDGHTQGQCMIYVDTHEGPVIFPGDLIPTENHLKEVYVMGYDMNPALSVLEKKQIFSEEHTQKSSIVFEHSPTKETIKLSS